MDSKFDPTYSPFTDADTDTPAVIASLAPKVPVDSEVKKLLVVVGKGIRDAQAGHDKYLDSKPQIALSFQKNMITLMRLQLDALRMNFEMQGGKLAPTSNTNSTTNNNLLVLDNDARSRLANILSGQNVMGSSERVPVAEPLAGNGGGSLRE